MKTELPFEIIPVLAAKRFILLIIFFLTVSSVFAQTTTWNGSISSDWNVAKNWSDGMPGTDVSVIIPNTNNNPVIEENVAAVVKSLLVESNATLTIRAKGSLTINGFASYTSPFSLTAALNNLGTIINSGQIILGSTASAGAYGILNQGTFTNTGSIQINNTTDTAVYNASGTFTNEASIAIGDVANVGNHGIWNDDVFQNKSGGSIYIDRSSLRGLVNNVGVSGDFTTNGLIVIGKNAPVGTNGVENRATLTVAGCGKLLVLRGTFLNETAKTVINGGFIRVTNNLTNKGTFTNTSVVKYGSLTGSITNNNIVVNNAPAQIFSYGPGSRGLHGIFTDSLGTESAGTFSGLNDFTPFNSVPYGSSILWAKVSVEGCEYVVPFTYQRAKPTATTWTGDVNSVWDNAGNWSDGVPDESMRVVIPDKTNDPVIGDTMAALTKSLLIENGALLSVEAGGSLSINGSATYNNPFTLTTALKNQGTIRNSGAIFLGSVSSIGAFGIVNQGTIDNEAGGEITIDRFEDTGIYNTSSGTFENESTMTIGSSTTTGVHGIFNEAIFNNNTGGHIKIDRGSIAGIRNRSGTFTNAANITLGANVSTGTYGIQNDATFSHTAGDIKIDDCSDTGVYNTYTGTFNNSATLTIGSLKTIGANGIFNQLIFNNRGNGDIRIVRATTTGLRNYGGTFTNADEASITIGTVSAGFNGIRNEASFLNTTDAQITIDNASSSISGAAAISNEGAATFTNSNGAAITIGAVKTGLNGIRNGATFLNKTGGRINIDNAPTKALHNLSTGNFTNDSSAIITIGAVKSGSIGIDNQSSFFNKNEAQIKIDNTLSAALASDGTGNFTNEASITIGAAQNGTPSVSGIANSGSFLNAVEGDIRIDNTSYSGLDHVFNSSKIFTNSGKITIGATKNVGEYGINAGSNFNNNATGILRIDRTSEYGLSKSSTGTFSNHGRLIIGELASVGDKGIVVYGTFDNEAEGQIYIGKTDQGIVLFNNGVFDNSGIVTIGSASDPVTDLIAQTTTETTPRPFRNNSGGVVKGTGNIKATYFTHNGGTISPGYSPGVITFNGNQDLTNSILSIEVNGTGAAGTDFDQIIVSGTATLGDTLALSITHSGSNGDEVTIVSATVISGMFSSVTGLPPGWKVMYGSSTVKLVYDSTLPVTLIAFNASASGTGVRLQWRTAAESNNQGFYIERSTDARQWKDIGFVNGTGTTNKSQDYIFFDETPLKATGYYRLRQIDLDGSIEHSGIKSVRMNSTDKDLIVWTDKSRLLHIKTEDIVEQVTVFELSGRMLITTQQTSFDLSHVSSGILLVRVQTNRGTSVRKVLLL